MILTEYRNLHNILDFVDPFVVPWPIMIWLYVLIMLLFDKILNVKNKFLIFNKYSKSRWVDFNTMLKCKERH